MQPISFEFESAENPDWGYARNKRSVLMIPSAEWVQSLFSCNFTVNEIPFIAPNRDYPYEGLMAYHEGENWKFIDCIAISLRCRDGSFLICSADPTSTAIRVCPWTVTYRYRASSKEATNGDEALSFSITYFLHSFSRQNLVTGSIEISFENISDQYNNNVVLTIQPFVDIRHMYSNSNVNNYHKKHVKTKAYTCITLTSYNRTFSFYSYSSTSALVLFDEPHYINWWYKLGTGARCEAPGPQGRETVTMFRGENKSSAAFFSAALTASRESTDTARFFLACSLEDDRTSLDVADLEEMHALSMKGDRNQLEEITHAFDFTHITRYKDAIIARIIGFTKFKMNIHTLDGNQYVQVPHAGAWCFKTPWYRDVFESVLNNFHTLMCLPSERDNVKNIIWHALSRQNETNGLILNRLPEYKDLELKYNSSDATLLCFIAAAAYLQETKDLELAWSVLGSAMKAISCFGVPEPSKTPSADGPPKIHPGTGLLLSAPHHSWMDTRARSVECGGGRLEHLPSRVSEEFVTKLYHHLGNNQPVGTVLSSPCFLLPEINAQWIIMLRGVIWIIDYISSECQPSDARGSSLHDVRGTAASLLSRAEHNFLPVFWNDANGFLFNAVYEDGIIKDALECEPGVVAAALLGEQTFTCEQLLRVWGCITRTLLVDLHLIKYGNQTIPFGIMAQKAQNGAGHAFYDDPQYHSDVVWLRSTPNLLRLLRVLGMDHVMRDILVNTLDHQMTEGAIFYNHELFSRPFGNNPHPDKRTCRNPVPVKNPIQFWSQWCDPMIEFLTQMGGAVSGSEGFESRSG